MKDQNEKPNDVNPVASDDLFALGVPAADHGAISWLEESARAAEWEKYLDLQISEFTGEFDLIATKGKGVRGLRAFEALGVETLRDLGSKSRDDFLQLPWIGQKTVDWIEEYFLREAGIKLNQKANVKRQARPLGVACSALFGILVFILRGAQGCSLSCPFVVFPCLHLWQQVWQSRLQRIKAMENTRGRAGDGRHDP